MTVELGVPWLAEHTFLSLFRDVLARSFAKNPENR
jgi:hypothetical protein